MPGSSGRFNLYVEGFVVLMSVSIDVYLVAGPGGELALSPALDNSSDSLYVASAECVELKELAEEGRTFEEWVVEDFIGDLEEYLDDLKDAVFYRCATDKRVRAWLTERGFSLPVLRYGHRLGANGVPHLANTGADYRQQVDRLISFDLMRYGNGPACIRMNREPALSRFIAVEDPRNPRWVLQRWDWNAEGWADYGVAQSAVSSGCLWPSEVFFSKYGDLADVTHQLAGDHACALEEALDALSLDGTKHRVDPFVRYIGTGAQCGLALKHYARVYEGEVITLGRPE